MTFVSRQVVRFAHIDAAGIVFYPRYFEMLNAAVEDYFAREIGVDFAEMHLDRKLGIPTVSLKTEFVAPSRLGDELDFVFSIGRVGRSSADLSVEIRAGGEVRVRISLVLVCMDLETGRSAEWPSDMRPVPAAAAA
jgi:4-hydroxybenzoyl-CoA thioesterase